MSISKRPSVLAVGRRTRTVPPALRRALEVRDRGCRFPGCGLRFTDAHDIEHWADGGRTDLSNLVLLCRRHHRLVHEEGHRICMDSVGRVVFFAPNGRAIGEAAPMSVLDGTRRVEKPRESRRSRSAEKSRSDDTSTGADPWAMAPRYPRDESIPWEIEAAAREALDPCDEGVEERSAGPFQSVGAH